MLNKELRFIEEHLLVMDKECLDISKAKSKKWHKVERFFSSYFDKEKIYEEQYDKHFKKFYKGKPTKRYVKLMQKLKKINNVNPEDIEMLLLA